MYTPLNVENILSQRYSFGLGPHFCRPKNNETYFLKPWPPKYFTHLAHKSFKFFTTSPVPVCKSGQAFMVTGPHIASAYG